MRRFRGQKRRRGDGRKERNELRDAAKWKRTKVLREIDDRQGREIDALIQRFDVERRRVWKTWRKEVGIE